MVYKGFYYNIIVRIILLFLSSFWLSLCIKNPEKIYSLIIALSVSVIQIVSLINYINKINRDLSRFFSSLKDKDSSTHLNFSNAKGALKELGSTLNEISQLIGESRIESEKQSKYFEFVVEHIPIGLLTINKTGKIIHSNKAVKDFIKIEFLSNLEKLKITHPELVSEIEMIRPGEQKIFRTKLNHQFFQVLLKSTEFSFDNENLKLVSIQDVKNEIEKNELESWQKLIRVLTHEIMNSITPISTLTLAINKCLSTDGIPKTIENIKSETIQDVLINNKLIEERSIGLRSFVEKYKSLTKIQALKITRFNVTELLNKTITLFNDDIQNRNINIKIQSDPENILLDADQKLLEQVLINLIKNSIESFKESHGNKISLRANYNSENKLVISISDNGPGISEQLIDQIFIPFFTTKEQGSGIGLSLARQIMHLHEGNIEVQSVPNKVTSFILTF